MIIVTDYCMKYKYGVLPYIVCVCVLCPDI